VFDINTVFAGIMVLTGFALALDAVVSVVEKRLLVWRPRPPAKRTHQSRPQRIQASPDDRFSGRLSSFVQ